MQRYHSLFIIASSAFSSYGWITVDSVASSLRESLTSVAAGKSDAEELRRRAQQLRHEVNQFEKEKLKVEMKEVERELQITAEKEALRERYSAIVPILKPDGTTVLERCDFEPRYKKSSIRTIEAPLPLGILLGECDDGSISIDEVADEGNGADAGLEENDLIRAFTACKMEMETPTWQLMAGGIGVPKTKRFMYSADSKPLEEVMEAVASNRMDPEGRPVLLVIEREEE